ncbi:hypothetical protein CK623_04365 [Vandammella animalimorsus]|uniref:Uncharacterized protein n=1 Tax=Vandammella animalimorsus TaxID=2029117 RepID=A0A2A2ARY3_9BURK|nr:hypothetical protein [Vandammella animalimorsus]PAT40616.1 hypothetical protein CK623_04365 [Vandammella animalimorsus]
MATIDNYQRQLGILAGLKENIGIVRNAFISSQQKYREQIEQAAMQKYMGDYVEQLKIRFAELASVMEEIFQVLQRTEMEIETQRTRLNQLIAQAQQPS